MISEVRKAIEILNKLRSENHLEENDYFYLLGMIIDKEPSYVPYYPTYPIQPIGPYYWKDNSTTPYIDPNRVTCEKTNKEYV